VEIQLKKVVGGTDALKNAIEERIREATKLRGNVSFVKEIPEDSKKIEDKRTWQ
jgi:hypothetical protein